MDDAYGLRFQPVIFWRDGVITCDTFLGGVRDQIGDSEDLQQEVEH